MTNSRRPAAKYLVSAVSTLALLAAAGVARAEAVAADAHTSVIEGDVQDVKIIAPKNAAATVAPIKSSLAATEPQAVVDRAFIEQNTPAVGDYTTTISLAPSMISAGNANGPGATDGAKLSLRGIKDGQFNITYDGIPWGDTNGPSHHANSFFPNSTIGGVIVDRGPGKATDIGQASFGGSVNLFSLPLEEQLGARQKATFGSWGTWQSVTTLFTGPVKQLHDANVLVNFQEYHTDGYLTNSPSEGANQYIKVSVPLTSKIMVTGLFTRNDDNYNQSDDRNGTFAEILKTGQKNFGLCNDPNYACYKNYNYTKKQTDFEYVKEAGEILPGFDFDNTTYSYWYTNKTLTANSQDYFTPATTAQVVTNITGVAYPAAGKKYTNLVPGLPGYLKRNEYRVTGDVIRFTKDLGEGTLSFGGLYEVAHTKRFTFQIALPAPGTGITGYDTPDYGQVKAATFPNNPAVAGCYGYATISAPGKTNNGACQTPLNVKYNQYSGWHYWQTFAQYEWRLTDKLTVTPGVKYINYELFIHAPVNATTIQPLYMSKVYDKTLGYLTVNYRITPFWSAYVQASQGFLVPDISAMYVTQPNLSGVQPQTSMAYQVGTVFARGNLTVDVDAYNIDFDHKLQSVTVTDNTSPYYNQTFYTNSGGAFYRGFEGQGTYVLPYGLSAFGNLSILQAVGKSDPINPGGNGKQLDGAPRWTAAWGLRFNHKHLIVDRDELTVTVDDKYVGPQMANAAKGAAAPNGAIKTWNQANLSATYKFGQYAIQAQVLNLFDHQYLTGVKGSGVDAGGHVDQTLSASNNNAPQYLTPRSYQITLRAAF